ncbi:MAG: iron complex outermembrane recepter [Geobacteraceae bacterium]|nr:MAG: iron complex outermembrane recepter [Geobacteraceae bacterium]
MHRKKPIQNLSVTKDEYKTCKAAGGHFIEGFFHTVIQDDHLFSHNVHCTYLLGCDLHPLGDVCSETTHIWTNLAFFDTVICPFACVLRRFFRLARVERGTQEAQTKAFARKRENRLETYIAEPVPCREKNFNIGSGLSSVDLMRIHFLKIAITLLAALLLYPCPPARAESEEEMQTLDMFYEAKDLVVAATRNPKPLSQVAENLTVISAGEIEAMNAHTLTDVLVTVTGVQVDRRGGPGSLSGFNIQGAPFNHILVLIDGVPFNNLSDNFADIGVIPVRQIERIEIIKGPATSSWGQALGGVINIVTKSPPEEGKLGGALSASIGERTTGDYLGEAAGALGRFGYYLFAGKLASDGLLPNNDADETNVYTKLRWDMPERGNLLLALSYHEGERGEFASPVFDLSSRFDYRYLLLTPTLTCALTDRLTLELAARLSQKDTEITRTLLSTGAELMRVKADESVLGGSAKLTWRQEMNNLALGADFDHGDTKLNNSLVPLGGLTRRIDKVGIFVNDTLTIKGLAVTPGIRYDRSNTHGDFLSPSLGATYTLTDRTLLRAYAARGYSLPSLLLERGTEKVWTYQAGIESTEIGYLWMKATLFRNDTWDIPSVDFATGAVKNEKHRKQGVEVEIKTVPFHNTSLAAGFAYVDAGNRDTGERLTGIARNTFDLGLHYDDGRSLRGALTGHYIRWVADPGSNGKFSAVIWDLNLAKKIFGAESTAVELFLTAHNIFNGAQYQNETFKNPRRWFEGGIRFKF